MTQPLHYSREARLPAHQVDLQSFDRILALFESEFDHLICQADLPGEFFITEDSAGFVDAISEHPQVTNIRVRGWSHAEQSEPLLGELLLTDFRADVRVDGYPEADRADRFVRSVAAVAAPSRRAMSLLYSPWLLAAGLLAGAAAGALFARGLGQAGWIAPVVAAVPGALIGVVAAIIVMSCIQIATPYAAVRGLGLRGGRALDPAARGLGDPGREKTA